MVSATSLADRISHTPIPTEVKTISSHWHCNRSTAVKPATAAVAHIIYNVIMPKLSNSPRGRPDREESRLAFSGSPSIESLSAAMGACG
eukprot:13535-Pyramimonas_sp.AAC.1